MPTSLVPVVLSFALVGCCFGASGASDSLSISISIDERELTGDTTHLHLPFELVDIEDHPFTRSGHARLEIHDLPIDSSGLPGTLGSIVCVYETHVAASDFGAHPRAAVIEATFSPPCPAPPTAPTIVREGIFVFTPDDGTALPRAPIRILPPALSGGRDRASAMEELAR